MLKLNALLRATTIRRGNGISRLYHNAKNMRNMEISFAATEFVLAAEAAKRKDLVTTLFAGGLSMYFVKKAEKFNKARLALQTQYQSIVNRAKQIYK